VNIASRIEGLNKQFGTSICISDSVYERVADRVVARPLQRPSVKVARLMRDVAARQVGVR
jgi:adenylate cyclase